MTLLFPNSNRVLSLRGSFFPLKLLYGSHIHVCFVMTIENVGLEPLLCVPNAACSLNTSFSATPAGIEPAPPERQSGVLAVIRWSYIFFLFPSIEKAACLFGQAAFQHQSLQSIWLSRGSHKGSRSQTST